MQPAFNFEETHIAFPWSGTSHISLEGCCCCHVQDAAPRPAAPMISTSLPLQLHPCRRGWPIQRMDRPLREVGVRDTVSVLVELPATPPPTRMVSAVGAQICGSQSASGGSKRGIRLWPRRFEQLPYVALLCLIDFRLSFKFLSYCVQPRALCQTIISRCTLRLSILARGKNLVGATEALVERGSAASRARSRMPR